MLEHFHAGDDVEALRLFEREILGADLSVCDLEAAFEQVQLRDLERLVGKIDSGDARSARSHAFGKNAAAAAHVEHAPAVERGMRVDPIDAQRIDVVQRFEFAVGIPPAVRELAEFLDLGRIDVDAHGLLLEPFPPVKRARLQVRFVQTGEAPGLEHSAAGDPHVHSRRVAPAQYTRWDTGW